MPDTRQQAFDLIKQVLSARGELSAEDEARMSEVAQLFGVERRRDAQISPLSPGSAGTPGKSILTRPRAARIADAEK